MEVDFDLCIIGAGIIGTAAARHATTRPGVNVCLVGLSEPKDGRSMTDGRDIYGAHYDEGRITRACDSDPVWASLAKQSIQRYRQLEHLSGIPFYNEVGSLMVGTSGEDFVKSLKINATDLKVNVTHINSAEIAEKFPYLNISSKDEGVYEFANAGCISPRKMVEAQKCVAAKQGCIIYNDAANKVTRVVSPDGTYEMLVRTDTGREIKSKCVLLATGAFTTFRELLPRGVKPDQLLCPLTVSLVEVSANDAQRLRQMPPVIYKGHGHTDWHEQTGDASVSFYMLPPIQYPDGLFYIKLGYFHGSVSERYTTSTEVKRWFEEGNKQQADFTAKFLKSLFKGVRFKSWHGDYCIVVETPTNRPYIDMVHSQLGVALGGNGYAAKSGDEIGRLAAGMMFGSWDSDIPRDVFKVKLLNENQCPTKTPSML